MNVNRRLTRFLHALASGYALLAANTLYVLASVPLALHYLPTREFGLWALAMQLTGYLQLIDLGMSASVSRHLIDHKDRRDSGGYGSTIKTGFLVLLVQGILVLLVAATFMYFGTALLRIDRDLEHTFFAVMLVQCTIVAADFPARLANHMLVAHQRSDITNYIQIGMFICAFLTLWLCFSDGIGIFSLVWANLVAWAGITVGNIAFCKWLKLFPSLGTWGRASWTNFRYLFGYGTDVFWIALGAQMINASQSIVITRAMGLNAAAVWSVCTRTFTLGNQLVWRPFDFSYPMLSEMVACGEKQRLLHRFKGIVLLTTSLAVFAAVMFALCNQPFVALWTHKSISWGNVNNVLLSAWLIVLALVHCHCGLVVITKKIGFMRYIYFIEGALFLTLGSYAAARFGFTGLLVASLVSTIVFSFSYGIYRTRAEFNLTAREVLWEWLKPSRELLVLLGGFGLLLYWLTHWLPPKIQLPLYGVLVGLVGTLLLIRRGLGHELVEEFRQRIPRRLSRFVDPFVTAAINPQQAKGLPE